jgi:P-type Cu2+ transporter
VIRVRPQPIPETCHHCGLPLPKAGPRFVALIDGERRQMCCVGCQAVAEAIAGSGLSAYYRTRTAYAAREVQPAQVDLALYDLQEVQRGFVRETAPHELEATLILEGITCAACIWLNEQHLSSLPGVLTAEVNYTTRRARVLWDPCRIKLSEILAQVALIGYRAWPAGSAAAEQLRKRETRAALWRLFVAGFGMMQVMMYALPAYLAADGTMTEDIRLLMRLASLLLTIPVVLYSAAPFFRGAWRDLRRRRLRMDVPVALGIAVAFIASVVATFAGGAEVYFDSITMFVFFLLCGRYLEMRARQKAADSLEYLDKALPLAAHRLSSYPASMQTEEVPAVSLQRGDLVLVRPGESFPADGDVVEGDTESDESLLSGESLPVRKPAGSEVTGGAVNRLSPVVIRVGRVGEETRVSAIRRLIERGSAQRPRISELTDRIAGWFVAAVIVVAAASALYWLRVDATRTLWVAVAVLVVSCPCALSLAMPVALAVAVGQLARRGVVATRGHALEGLAEATHVVFDKTGTLTEGEFALCATHCMAGVPRERCLALAAALESGSEHPIAAALLRAAPRREDNDAAAARRNMPGAGIEASIAGTRYRIGTRAFVSALAGAPAGAPPLEKHMVTRIWLGGEHEWLACFDFEDRIRPEAEPVVRRLQDDGKQVLILSGDAFSVVQAVAKRLGVENYAAELSPADKQARVQALQQEGACVAMVGDGVNDAPVLAQAQLSIALDSGALMAQAQADLVLLSRGLRGLLDALDIAHQTRRIVRQNLGWALGYNTVALPFAVAGLVTPWMAGIGMASSSLLVVLNALRLMRGREAGKRSKAPKQRPRLSARPRPPARAAWTSSTSSSRFR